MGPGEQESISHMLVKEERGADWAERLHRKNYSMRQQ